MRVVGAFVSPEAMQAALPRLREAGFAALETYTPVAPGEPRSIVPLIILIAGVLGAVGGFLLQCYADMVSYPIDVGGRPDFSWPAFVPIAFEIGVMTAMLAGLVAFLVVNRLPRLYDPIDEVSVLRQASFDRWCIAIRTDDADSARRMLWRCAAREVEEAGE
jgi:Protein of unknown function (DUF3341)